LSVTVSVTVNVQPFSARSGRRSLGPSSQCGRSADEALDLDRESRKRVSRQPYIPLQADEIIVVRAGEDERRDRLPPESSFQYEYSM
jgi:hypothetical protein